VPSLGCGAAIAEVIGPIEDSCRNHAARVGKAVRVVTSGLDLRVPARLERALGTIAHLTRNAIDHALEAPEDRGDKTETGTIAIAVRADPEALVIEVSDDGRGIDAARVTARAVATTAISRERADRLTRAEAIELVFLDGVSTSASVSETSGRGVGMAAVKQMVVEAGGTIALDTELGRGTRVVMRLPDLDPSPT
jgi:two-component system, chemotaxis family, sensor kinase CheA